MAELPRAALSCKTARKTETSGEARSPEGSVAIALRGGWGGPGLLNQRIGIGACEVEWLMRFALPVVAWAQDVHAAAQHTGCADHPRLCRGVLYALPQVLDHVPRWPEPLDATRARVGGLQHERQAILAG